MDDQNKYIILGIESSCDDTSVAIMSQDGLIAMMTQTQINHAQYGGVVPELASRTHIEDIVKVVDSTLNKAGVSKKELDAIAVTRGPGLMGSLIVGVSFAKGLSQALEIPLIEVHHMHAHILAHHIGDPMPQFPYICLTVSGGHTQIVFVKSYKEMKILGKTRDDAAGEAFDKTGKMLELEYPAGPIIDKLSQKGTPTYNFPIADIPAYDYSFSGLKTAIRRFLQKGIKGNPNFIKENLENICASVQNTIVLTLIEKLEKAADDHGINTIAIAGGVAANSGLRSQLERKAKEKNWDLFIPKFSYCTDNAAMIARAAGFKYEDRDFSDLSIAPLPRMKF